MAPSSSSPWQPSLKTFVGSPSSWFGHHQQSPYASHSCCGYRCHSVKAATPNGAGASQQLQEIASAALIPSIADFCNKICHKRTSLNQVVCAVEQYRRHLNPQGL